MKILKTRNGSSKGSPKICDVEIEGRLFFDIPILNLDYDPDCWHSNFSYHKEDGPAVEFVRTRVIS